MGEVHRNRTICPRASAKALKGASGASFYEISPVSLNPEKDEMFCGFPCCGRRTAVRNGSFASPSERAYCMRTVLGSPEVLPVRGGDVRSTSHDCCSVESGYWVEVVVGCRLGLS